MVKTLKSRTVVICGGGFTAGLISRQLTAKGIDVLVLERGGDHTGAAEAKLPNQRDELRWDVHAGLVQDWSIETYSLRHASSEEALPVRRMEAFLPGEGMGGAGAALHCAHRHWNVAMCGNKYDWQLSPRSA